MTPEAAREWIKVARDIAILCLAVFMLVYETIAKATPDLYIVGGALTLIGLPPAFRLDEIIRSTRPKGIE